MTVFMRASLLIAPLLITAPAHADPVPLRPTGKWVVNYADTQCSASRAYGTPERPLHLVIKPSPTSDVVQIALVKNGSKKEGVQEDATLKFGGRPPVKVKLLEYGVEKTNIRLINLDAALAGQMARETMIDWSSGADRTILQMGPLDALMKTLIHCRKDLRAYWNIDEARQATFKSRAKADLYRLFSTDDYPDQAVHQGDSGMTSVALLVDEKGAVKECMVEGTSGIPTLDAMTCIVLRQRAKFEPAVGPDGKPARDSVTSRIRWEMP